MGEEAKGSWADRAEAVRVQDRSGRARSCGGLGRPGPRVCRVGRACRPRPSRACEALLVRCAGCGRCADAGACSSWVRVAALSAREIRLLAALVRNSGRVLSRGQLLEMVWDLDFDPGSNVVDVYIAALRRKIGARFIETVRGLGYRFVVPTSEPTASRGTG